MTTLSLFKFNSPDGAEQALNVLRRLQQQHLIELQDVAVVSWSPGSKAPKMQHALNMTRTGALSGAFWGLLIGVLFFLPLLGLLVGTATGATTGFMSDVGIDPDFIGEIRRKVVPGTSALFLLTDHAVRDRVVPELRPLQPELITTNLPAEQEARLRELFSEDQE